MARVDDIQAKIDASKTPSLVFYANTMISAMKNSNGYVEQYKIDFKVTQAQLEIQEIETAILKGANDYANGLPLQKYYSCYQDEYDHGYREAMTKDTK